MTRPHARSRSTITVRTEQGAEDWRERALCLGRTEWTSDDAWVRAEAALACRGCPVIDLCAREGRDEQFGVWGGQDKGPKPPGRPRRTATQRAVAAAEEALASGVGLVTLAARLNLTPATLDRLLWRAGRGDLRSALDSLDYAAGGGEARARLAALAAALT